MSTASLKKIKAALVLVKLVYFVGFRAGGEGRNTQSGAQNTAAYS